MAPVEASLRTPFGREHVQRQGVVLVRYLFPSHNACLKTCSVVSSATPSCALFLTLILLYPASTSSFCFLQHLDSLALVRTRFARYCFASSLHDQLVQSPETRVHIVVLLAGVVRLDDQITALRRAKA